jgi:adenylylsulfate kinase
MVIWLIGLSGAGKTTIGRSLHKKLKSHKSGTVFVDGDELREVFSYDNITDSHTIEGRRLNGERILSICKWLDGQNIDVVCSILSIFPDLRRSARETFSRYLEVFIDVPLQTLIQRDSKQIYSRALSGKLKNVVGIDIPFPKPMESDLTISNNDSDHDIEKLVEQIMLALK